jgi:hypothetical protein
MHNAIITNKVLVCKKNQLGMNKLISTLILCILCLQSNTVFSQNLHETNGSNVKQEEKKWYDKMRLSGYAQFRYNRLFETNPNLKCDQCDRSWGDNTGFSFRRARLQYQGQAHERLFVYLQFDYSAAIRIRADNSENIHYLQLRDAYFDWGLDAKNEFRIRAGQSKVPYGFENLQSSSNRLPFDRADALNSAVPNERDFGIYFMWAPERIRKLQRDTLTNKGFKGYGDYGVFTIGAYNGQIANKPELNNSLHTVVKLSYPFRLGNQIIEPGVMAYKGQYTLSADQISSDVGVNSNKRYQDERVAVGIVIQPKPIGYMAEYTRGTSPGYSLIQDSIMNLPLEGGYITICYRTEWKNKIFIPFARSQYYKGAKKAEKDARFYELKEYEIGLECLLFKNLELTSSYVISHRKYSDHSTTSYDEKGNLLRLQLQFNY